MHPFLKILFTVTAVVLAGVVAVFWLIVQPGGDGVVAAIRLPDGTECMVTQRCNWSAEPYTVALYTREKDGPWTWCYIDHEATRWRRATMSHDPATDTVTITQRGTVAAVVDRPARRFRLSGMGDRDFPQRTGVTPPYPFPL